MSVYGVQSRLGETRAAAVAKRGVSGGRRCAFCGRWRRRPAAGLWLDGARGLPRVAGGMAEAAPAPGSAASIVKEGWLQKRGEHIRNWRDRYFILFNNGDLVGFKSQPERNNYREPLNKFTVRDCQIMAVDKPRPYTFTIRGLQWTTVIERNFSVDTEKERSVCL